MKQSRNFYEDSCQLVEEVFSKYWKKYLETPKKIKKLQILRRIIEELSWGLLELAGHDFSFRRSPLEEISKKIGIIEYISDPTAEAVLLGTENSTNPKWVVIHSHKSSIARRRFSLAHEIGHILLNHAEKKYPSLRRHNIEKICNKIAAELLLPKKMFEKSYSEKELKEILGKSARYYREKYRKEIPYEVFEDIETNGFRLKPEVTLAFKEYLGVSIDVLLNQLHWTNFLNLCNSVVIICKKSFNVFRGNVYDFRVYHRASPKWMYLPRNIRIREVISLNVSELFEKLNRYEKSNSKNEKLLVKVKKDEKWRNDVIESETECMRLSDCLILSIYY